MKMELEHWLVITAIIAFSAIFLDYGTYLSSGNYLEYWNNYPIPDKMDPKFKRILKRRKLRYKLYVALIIAAVTVMIIGAAVSV